jgi:aryl-alcohol dehydrogenase
MHGTAAILREANQPFSIEAVRIDPPRAGEILVRIHAVGICHTDMVFASGAMARAWSKRLAKA